MQVMRAITLAACALLFGGLLRQSLGDVTANWLSTTWISTGVRGHTAMKQAHCNRAEVLR